MVNIKYGSTGDDVKKLQTALGFTGGDVDGIFGEQTQKAVMDYQKNNGLTVDGIVGKNTWAALNKASTSGASTQAPAATAPAAPTAPTFENKPSDAVTQANALLQQHTANKPGEYQGGEWRNNLNETIAQILNREKFSYDLNGDMLYQQYKEQYTTQGKLAMMDTMGQAAAMTGGYGNSYAQTAGQQAYQAYLQKLNDVVPELYGMARDQYNQEGQDLYDRAGLMLKMDEQEFNRNQVALENYYKELGILSDNARYMSETEYKKALDDYDIKYGAYRDDVSDKRTAKNELISLVTSTGYVPSDAELAAAGMTRGEATALAAQYNREMELAYSSNSKGSAASEYVRPAPGGEEYKKFVDVYKTRGDDAAMSWAEAYRIDPALVVEWLEDARYETWGDNYYDPTA